MELKNEDGLTEKEFLAQCRPGNYERPSVTVDMLILQSIRRQRMRTRSFC